MDNSYTLIPQGSSASLLAAGFHQSVQIADFNTEMEPPETELRETEPLPQAAVPAARKRREPDLKGQEPTQDLSKLNAPSSRAVRGSTAPPTSSQVVPSRSLKKTGSSSVNPDVAVKRQYMEIDESEKLRELVKTSKQRLKTVVGQNEIVLATIQQRDRELEQLRNELWAVKTTMGVGVEELQGRLAQEAHANQTLREIAENAEVENDMVSSRLEELQKNYGDLKAAQVRSDKEHEKEIASLKREFDDRFVALLQKQRRESSTFSYKTESVPFMGEDNKGGRAPYQSDWSDSRHYTPDGYGSRHHTPDRYSSRRQTPGPPSPAPPRAPMSTPADSPNRSMQSLRRPSEFRTPPRDFSPLIAQRNDVPLSRAAIKKAREHRHSRRTTLEEDRQSSPERSIEREAERPRQRSGRQSDTREQEEVTARSHRGRGKRPVEKSKLRNEYLHEVRKLMNKCLEERNEVKMLVSASRGDVEAFNTTGDRGPNPEALWLDMAGTAKSLWNLQVFSILFDELKSYINGDEWDLDALPDNDLMQMFASRFKHMKIAWTEGQAKMTASGSYEGPEEIEARQNIKAERSGKEWRETTRRRQKYGRRVRTLAGLVELKTAEGSADVRVWEWLYDIILRLGSDGMSSEESGREDMKEILRPKKMYWRRNIDRELALIDGERMNNDDEIFSAKGSKPRERKRDAGNLESRRNPVTGLPRAFYSENWLSGLRKDEVRLKVKVSDESYQWKEFTVCR